MNGRAIYDSATGRCKWSASSASAGRALCNPLPSRPATVYWQPQPGFLWIPLAWFENAGWYYAYTAPGPGQVEIRAGTQTGKWRVTAIYVYPHNTAYTFERDGTRNWDVFGYYASTGNDFGWTRLGRMVSSVLVLTTTAYETLLPDGGQVSFTLRITAAGLKPIRVDGITYPAGFTGATWSGRLKPGEYHEEAVTASVPAYPPAVEYGGEIVVKANVGEFVLSLGLCNHQEED